MVNVYKISGLITYTVFPQESDANDDFSSAFDGIDKTWRVSQIVKAETKAAAIDVLRSRPGALPDEGWYDEDLADLTVEPAPPAVAMKALGIPTLFELEPPP
jgi:hypothetical protein